MSNDREKIMEKLVTDKELRDAVQNVKNEATKNGLTKEDCANKIAELLKGRGISVSVDDVMSAIQDEQFEGVEEISEDALDSIAAGGLCDQPNCHED